MDLAALLKVAGAAEELKPLVSQAVKAIKTFGPDVYELAEVFGAAVVDLKAAAVKRYEEHGFSREEAILMTLDSWQSLRNGVQKGQKKE